MKICWDNLEKVKFTKNSIFKINNDTYVEMESCVICGDSYLTSKRNQSKFCGLSCSSKNRIVSAETRRKISIANTGRICTVETRKKMSKNMLKRKGVLSPCYKGGVTKMGLITYDTCKDKLGPYEKIRKQEGTKILEARCAYCNRWYTPKWFEVRNRLVAINNLNKGEQRLYCSENCKLACPTYGKIKHPQEFRHTTSREVSTYLRQIVLKRDNWGCQICGKTIKEAQLHVHHMDPAIQNPMFQNDMDSCITLCKNCHEMVHSRKGCRYMDLICKKQNNLVEENNKWPMKM